MTEPSSWARDRSRVLRTSLSVGLTTGTYGASFGALAVAAGLSVTQACALSVLAFTGGSQYALIGVLDGGGSAVSGAVGAVLIGVRNMLYAVRLAPLLGLRGVRRAVGAQLVVDESTAVALGSEEQGTRAGRLGFWATGLTVFVLWNVSTLLGALAGSVLGDPRDFGLDAAVPAAMLALLAPRLRDRRPWLCAVVAGLVAVAVVPVAPVGMPVLVAAVVPVLFALSVRERTGREQG